MSDKLTVLWAHSSNTGLGYYRVWQPAKVLADLGLANIRRLPDHLPRIPFQDGGPDYDSTIGSWESMAKGCDLAVFQRMDTRQSVPLAPAMRHWAGMPYLAECDDNIFSLDATSIAFGSFKPETVDSAYMVRRFPTKDLTAWADRGKSHPEAEIIRLSRDEYAYVEPKSPDVLYHSTNFLAYADGITTTNEVLAKTLKHRLHYERPIYVVNNAMDLAAIDETLRLAAPAETPADVVRVGWFGSSTHWGDLLTIRELVVWILDTFPKTVFVCVGGIPDFWRDLPKAYPGRVEFGWGVPIQGWNQHLSDQRIDVGICPLMPTPFNDCKSELKWMEFSARSIPSLCVDFGPYHRAVRDGEDGFLYRSTPQWKERMTALIQDVDLRRQIGALARLRIERDYDHRNRAKEWLAVFEQAAAREPLAV